MNLTVQPCHCSWLSLKPSWLSKQPTGVAPSRWRCPKTCQCSKAKKPQSAHGFRLIGNHAHGQQLSNLEVYLSGEDWQRGVSVCSPYTSTSGTATEELFLCYHPIEPRNTSSTRHRFLGGRQECRLLHGDTGDLGEGGKRVPACFPHLWRGL